MFRASGKGPLFQNETPFFWKSWLRACILRVYEQIADITCCSDSVHFGDLHLPVSKWGEPLNSHPSQDPHNNIQESALHKRVSKPTRGSNILDIIFVN